MMSRLRFLLIVLVSSVGMFAQQPASSAEKSHADALSAQDAASPAVDIIPFTLTDANNISVPAVLNGKDKVELMLHTAINAVSVITSAADKTPSLTFDHVQNVKSWGGEQDARLSIGNTLQIGKQTWRDLTIGESEHSGPGTDGKFGLNLFEDRIVEINFDQSVVKLHAALPDVRNFERLDLTIEHGSMFVEGTLVLGETRLRNKFLVHSGYSGTILLDDDFVREHKLGAQLPLLSESELKDSFGNVLKTKKVRLPELRFGQAVFSEAPIGFFEGSIGRQTMSVLGGDLLKRFNLIVDVANKQLYVQPNSLFEGDFGK